MFRRFLAHSWMWLRVCGLVRRICGFSDVGRRRLLGSGGTKLISKVLPTVRGCSAASLTTVGSVHRMPPLPC